MRARLIPALCLAVASIGGCGGSSKRAADVDSSAGEAAESRGDEDDGAEASGDDEGEAAPSPQACSDETCFSCGEGLCLKGMYCDVNAGPGCSWLPECARQPSCACITRVLGSQCKCEDSGGGPQVECGSS